MKQYSGSKLFFYFTCLIGLSINHAFAGGTPDPDIGNSRDNQLLGSFNNTNGPAGGDFVNAAGTSGSITGLNSDWLYNIEVLYVVR